MAGLISANINQSNPMSSVAGYDAEKITLDENKDTVDGRVAGLIAKNSPLMQSAATRGRQASNSKGLLNTSMAIGDAERAVYDAALPIASQDANTSFQSKALNQTAGNQALAQTADAQTRGSLQQRAGQQAVEQIQSQGIISRQLAERQAELDRETQSQLQTQRGEQTLEQIEAQGSVQERLQSQQVALQKEMQLALQSNDIAAQKAIQERQAEISRQLQELSGQQAIEQIGAQGGIQRELAQMDITAREQFLERQAVLDQQMQGIVGEQAMAQIGAQGTIQEKLQAQRGAIDRALQSADAATQKELLNIRGGIDRQLQELSGQQAIAQIDRQGQIQATYQQAQNSFEANMQVLRGTQANELARINNASSELMQTSQSASMVMANSMQAIGQILSNPDIPATSKEALIGHQMRMLEASLAVTGSIARGDVNIDDILDFGQGNTGGQQGGNPQAGGPQDFGYDFPSDGDSGLAWARTTQGIYNNFSGMWDSKAYGTSYSAKDLGGVPIPVNGQTPEEAYKAWNGKGKPPEGYAQITKDGKVRLWHLGKWVYE